MIAKQYLSAAGLMLAAGTALAADNAVVQAECEAAGKKASILMDHAGSALVQVGEGDGAYRCQMGLDNVEGPPFSDNATGMLVLELARHDCTPASAKRKVQRDVFLHISDPKLASREGMVVVERRVALLQCRIPKLDLAMLAKLRTQLADQPPE
jgi:hypothetical protein